jgi:hypothetical protein
MTAIKTTGSFEDLVAQASRLHPKLMQAGTPALHSQADGSVSELETQLILSTSLGFTTDALAAPVLSLLDEVRRMLNALRRSLVTRH